MILSIIIPVYNVEKYVEKCVKSCLSQDISSDEYEIIIINDGSTDSSQQIVEKLADQTSLIKIFSQPNGGLSKARNVGMSKAKGRYLMFVDSDDWIEHNSLSRIVNKLRIEEPDCLAICAADFIEGTISRRFSYKDTSPICGIDFLRQNPPHCAPFSIWKSSFLRKFNLSFVEGIFHEDSEFTPRAYYYAEKISFLNDIIYYVYHNPCSITRSINPQKSYDLIESVSENLSRFSERVEFKNRYIYDNLISLLINSALANIRDMSANEINILNRVMYEHRRLFKHLTNSTKLKYKVEGVLFALFPHYTSVVYQMITVFR